MSTPGASESGPGGTVPPLTGLRVVEMGSGTALPYLAKLLVDTGAEVIKVESPSGDPFRTRSVSGGDLAGQDSAWWRFLNAGKSSQVVDLATGQGGSHTDTAQSTRGNRAGGLGALAQMVQSADLVLDDHQPGHTHALGISPDQLRAMNPAAVIATLTPFGATGPWADRPANDFTLEALTGAVDGRGVPGEEPVSVGGNLGDFVGASLSAAPILAATMAARASGVGCHIDVSQFESMMWAFTVFRAMYDTFAPDFRPGRQIEVPSIEPCADGSIGYCTVTGQQWLDFCAMIGAPELGEAEELRTFEGRMNHRERVWAAIRSFTETRGRDELAALAADMRIPTGPIGTGDVVAHFDHFVDQGFYTTSAHGFTQPVPGAKFSISQYRPPATAPKLDQRSAAEAPADVDEVPVDWVSEDPRQPLAGIRVLDLTAFIAGPFAANMLRMLGADLIKVESTTRLDGMRWASGGIGSDPMFEWSPGYHGVNAGKELAITDLSTEAGLAELRRMIAEADVVIENFSPRVIEQWGLGWEEIQKLNPNAILVRMPAFGIDGPWRDRVGFAMTMEQVSGLANRTGHPNGPPQVPKGPVDYVSGSHAAFATIVALAERARTGRPQQVVAPLILGALQAAAEQVVEHSAYDTPALQRIGNRSPDASPQGIYQAQGDDQWVAVSIETDAHWQSLAGVVDGLDPATDRHTPDQASEIDHAISAFTATRTSEEAEQILIVAGIPAAAVVHFNDARHAEQLQARGFYAWHDHPVTGATPYHHLPFHLDGAPLPVGGPAPTLPAQEE